MSAKHSAEISQLPVMQGERVIGIIDESDVLLKVASDAAQFRSSVDGTMTHATIPAAQRAMLGITDALVRLSVGFEDIDDLRLDLSLALDAI